MYSVRPTLVRFKCCKFLFFFMSSFRLSISYKLFGEYFTLTPVSFGLGGFLVEARLRALKTPNSSDPGNIYIDRVS